MFVYLIISYSHMPQTTQKETVAQKNDQKQRHVSNRSHNYCGVTILAINSKAKNKRI